MRLKQYGWGACLLALSVGAAERDELLAAYRQMNYPRAIQLARAQGDDPEARLIEALCMVHDKSDADVVGGLAILRALYADESLPAAIRLEAGLETARLTQLMKARPDLYGDGRDLPDHIEIFRAVMKLGRGSAAERDAFFYLIREELERESTQEAAFAELETFLADFEGDPKLLTPVLLLAEYEYIRLRGDYPSAVRHLRRGCELGFANPGEGRAALFRLGFFCYKKLNDPAEAKRCFQAFIETYPQAAQSVVAKRFLQEIQAHE